MYGLDPAIGISFIQGRELIQVAVGRYQVQFNFDQNVRISAERKYEYQSKGEIAEWEPAGTNGAAPVLRLLGAKVTRARGTKEGTLTLEFDNGDALVFYDTSDRYESYTITRPGTTIVV